MEAQPGGKSPKQLLPFTIFGLAEIHEAAPVAQAQ